MINNIIRLIRVKQWVKNSFIFIPLFFSGNLMDSVLFFKTFFAFISFSFLASSVYVINDWVDIEKDALHPTKKFRPLPSGLISKNQAIGIFVVLMLISISLIVFLIQNNLVIFLLAFYFIMNIAYSFKLKNTSIIDITIIAVGFLIRVLVGGYATGVMISKWTILLTFVLALILAIGKRRGELVGLNEDKTTRKALKGYSIEMLDMALSIMSAVTIVCYIMYTFSPEAIHTFKQNYDYVYFTVIFLIMAILRYIQQTLIENKTESPTKFLYKDFFLQIVLLAWTFSFFVLIYLNSIKEFLSNYL
jgi:decaprenyl-phosphate phosphoribosyltransferase